MAFLQISELNFSYTDTKKPALFDINIEVQKGEFVLLCGPSGCGKTTLLRHLKPQLEPAGTKTGDIFLDGIQTISLDERTAAEKVGLILQNPESQIVAETVRHELAFGLECLGMPPPVISKRISETVSYFGIEDIYSKKTEEISGGEKQLVSIAAIMAMRPELLLLDEPASQLDPIAARNLYDILLRLNNELGITIIISEHRIDDIFSIVDRVAVMNEGELICVDIPRNTAAYMSECTEVKIREMLPVPSKLYREISSIALGKAENDESLHLDTVPVTVREVKPWFEAMASEKLHLNLNNKKNDDRKYSTQINVNTRRESKIRKTENKADTAITLDSLYFRFGKNNEDIVKNLTLRIIKGEVLSVLGGNGAGKTTLLRLICGLIKPYSGKVIPSDSNLKIAYLPQNPQSMFAFDTVIEDLLCVADALGGGKHFLYASGIAGKMKYNIPAGLRDSIDRLGIEQILEKHPYDLSFGELQRAALAMLLLKTPDVILLDEPTKGIDTLTKRKTAELLKSFCDDGMAVVAVTHDIEFAAEYSNTCAMLFDGRILNVEPPAKFFSGNMCYTTAAHRIAGNIFPEAVICEEVRNKWIEFATNG